MAPFVSSEKEWTRRPMRLLQWACGSDEEQEEDIYKIVYCKERIEHFLINPIFVVGLFVPRPVCGGIDI
jgi:hypothetical protein